MIINIRSALPVEQDRRAIKRIIRPMLGHEVSLRTGRARWHRDDSPDQERTARPPRRTSLVRNVGVLLAGLLTPPGGPDSLRSSTLSRQNQSEYGKLTVDKSRNTLGL